MQQNFSFIYKGEFMQVIGKWNLGINANYDLMRWTNFSGLGNDTKLEDRPTTYYQVQSRDLLASIALNHPLGKHASFSIGPVYNMVTVLENKERFIYQLMHSSNKVYEPKHFGGAQASVSVILLDDPVIPTKGISFLAGAQYLKNLKETDKQVARFNAGMRIYLPVIKNHLVIALHPAAATVTGEPEFYQYVSIGGSSTLRGYNRDRFWGTSSFYSGNQLQYLFNLRTHLLNAKVGLVGFYDVGRVWLKNETSDTWHTGYGGGLMIAPFNKFMASVMVGRSTEGNQIHIRFVKGL